MSAPLAPLYVSDVRDDAYWYSVDKGQGDTLRAWLRGNGLEPDDIYRFEVYLCDTLFAKVYTYARDEHGRFQVEGDGLVEREPFLAPLDSMPPGSPENRGSQIHGETRTGSTPTQDTRDAPNEPPRPAQGRARPTQPPTCA